MYLTQKIYNLERWELFSMEMNNKLTKKLEGLSRDQEFEDYIDAECIKAVDECREYIEREYSQEYTDAELAIMRERLIYKKAWFSALRLALEYKNI